MFFSFSGILKPEGRACEAACIIVPSYWLPFWKGLHTTTYWHVSYWTASLWKEDVPAPLVSSALVLPVHREPSSQTPHKSRSTEDHFMGLLFLSSLFQKKGVPQRAGCSLSLDSGIKRTHSHTRPMVSLPECEQETQLSWYKPLRLSSLVISLQKLTNTHMLSLYIVFLYIK